MLGLACCARACLRHPGEAGTSVKPRASQSPVCCGQGLKFLRNGLTEDIPQELRFEREEGDVGAEQKAKSGLDFRRA